MPRPILLIAGGSRGIGAATVKMAGARGYEFNSFKIELAKRCIVRALNVATTAA